MADFVKIENGQVIPLIITKLIAVQGLIDQGVNVIEVTGMDYLPTTGWTYDEDGFHMPLLKHAKVENNIITEIFDSNEVDASFRREEGETIHNINDINPQPQIGWVFSGEHFEEPE